MLRKTLLGIVTATIVTTAALSTSATTASAGSFSLHIGGPAWGGGYGHGHYDGDYGYEPYAPAFYRSCRKVRVRYWNGFRYRVRRVRKCRRIYY